MKLQKFRENQIRYRARYRFVYGLIHTNLAYFKRILLRLWIGYRKGQFLSYSRWLLLSYHRAATQLVESFSDATEALGDLRHPRLQKLRSVCQGLHEQMAKDGRFRFSVLVPVYKPIPRFFKTALESILDQTSPHFEVLVGFDGPQPTEVYEVIEQLRLERAEAVDRLVIHEFDRSKGGGISRTTNQLAARARYEYLLLMDHDDWIRPDLLFRYEQTLRLCRDPENQVLYCDECKITERDQLIPTSSLRKPDEPRFPYIFINWICHALLVPKSLWDRAGALRPECDGAQDYDLCLRLDAGGARFQNVPVVLYAWRAHSGSTAQHTEQKDYATSAGVRALQGYVRLKGLQWSIDDGLFPSSYRAIPAPPSNPSVLVVMPYKDQKAITLKAAQKVLASKGCNIHLCAVDNRSSDASIAIELKKMGAEVLVHDEAFNFSRINNMAVARSADQNSPYVLFLNNDVELLEDAVLEMLRWVEQPKIGIVGCRLFFPREGHYDPNHLRDHPLQHGGVELSPQGPHWRMQWSHIDKMAWEAISGFSRVIQVVDAVTAAAALMRRDLFLDIGGFDETWYPIAFSDTDLATKIRSRGLWCLQTPYAKGIHHESISRAYHNIEDYESTRWLYQKVRAARGEISSPEIIRGCPYVE